MKYLVRSDTSNTYLASVEGVLLATIPTNFIIENQIPSAPIIADGKKIGYIEITAEGISCTVQNKEIASFKKNLYFENGINKSVQDVPKQSLGQQDQFGLQRAYSFDKESSLESVVCFEKEGNIAGLISTRNKNDDAAYRGLLVTIAQRLSKQEYIIRLLQASF
jgi:hypothetical protein